MNGVTWTLADFVAGIRYEDLPGEVVAEAKRRIADVLGIGLSGSVTEVGKQITNFAAERGGKGKATIWGSNKKTSAAYASLANGTMTFHLELDDVHRTSHTHPGVSVVPAALALCEEMGLGGRELVTATVLGYEAVIRIGMAVSPSIYVDRVLMAPGTLSPLGSAIVAAKLKGLDTDKTARVFGSSSFLGPLAPFEAYTRGTTIKETIMGWSNLVGIYSAELSSYGLSGPVTAMEGDFGYCKAVSEKYDLDRITTNLGKVFEIVNSGIKPYACCRQHHSAIDAVLELREKHGIKAEDVASIKDRTFKVASRGKEKRPVTIAGAKYSAPYIIAVALLEGKAWREQFSPEKIADERILSLASKVEVLFDAELDTLYDEKWPTIIEITTKDGKTYSSRKELMKGEPEFPISNEELKGKYSSLSQDKVSQKRSEELWEAIFDLENHKDMSKLSRLVGQEE